MYVSIKRCNHSQTLVSFPTFATWKTQSSVGYLWLDKTAYSQDAHKQNLSQLAMTLSGKEQRTVHYLLTGHNTLKGHIALICRKND